MITRTVSRILFISYLLMLPSACTTAVGSESMNMDGPVPILGTVSGDLPVAALQLLPPGQQQQPVGYLSSQAQLDAVFKSIEAGGKTLPPVDFSKQIVLFTRNTVFYNRLSIGQVQRSGAVLSVLAMETMSARPITDKVAISLAVISLDGARYIDTGGQKIEIER